ncbi:hypothetical protein [Paenibacillus sp. KS-LC4]|uniref:hypothetical protein n=1 Tax=Paenibacillus sp. KS-LC4 TaxID=2979727 RepID=UPI0030D55F71
MINIFLIVVGCYVLAGFLVHVIYRLKRHRQHSTRHYVLLCGSQHANMERTIRSFFAFSRWMGVDVQLTVIDAGLGEQTREIVERMSHAHERIRLYRPEAGIVKKEAQQEKGWLWELKGNGLIIGSEPPVLIDLQNPEDLSKLPF